MQQQWQDGVRAFLEVGPKAVLSKMAAPCLAPITEEKPSTACLTDFDQEAQWS